MEFQFLSSYMRSIYTMKWPSTTIVWLSLLESGEKVKFVENSFISWIYNSSQWKWICRQCVVGLSSQFHHCVKLTWKWGGQIQIYANWISYRALLKLSFFLCLNHSANAIYKWQKWSNSKRRNSKEVFFLWCWNSRGVVADFFKRWPIVACRLLTRFLSVL